MTNVSLICGVAEVNGQPNMQESRKDESLMASKVKKQILNDVVSMIGATDQVFADVAEALNEVIGDNLGVMGISCHISHDLCLSRHDLSYLLDSRREALNKGSFRNLYPALTVESQKSLIDELSQLIVAQSVGHSSNDLWSIHKTADLHPLLMSLERYYYRHILDEEYGDSAGAGASAVANAVANAATNDDQLIHFNQIALNHVHNNSVFFSDKNSFDSSVINGCSDGKSEIRC